MVDLVSKAEVCARFRRECLPGKLVLGPLSPVRRIGGSDSDWWYETYEPMAALGVTWLGYLFSRRGLLDHDWRIGPDEREPWALVSEPYPSAVENVKGLRAELAELEVELTEFPVGTHRSGGGSTVTLVAWAESWRLVNAAVAREIVKDCVRHQGRQLELVP